MEFKELPSRFKKQLILQRSEDMEENIEDSKVFLEETKSISASDNNYIIVASQGKTIAMTESEFDDSDISGEIKAM